jgi:HlyD family secretion protein
VLTAPFDGVIAVNNLRVGELPPQTQPAMLLTDLSEYYVDLAIDETDIVNVEVGQPVELRLDALPDAEIVGRVTNVAVSPTIAGQLVTYRVRVTLDPTDEPVRIGMSATATIVVNEVDETLVLPNRFIRIDRTTQEAYVTIEREPGLFEEISVVLGARNETESEIISGLQAGQRVVLLPRAAFDVFG